MTRAVFIVLALLACGASAALPAQRQRKPVTHSVTIDATRFEPETLTIRAGDTVVWTNKDLIPHTASQPSGFDSGTILAGESWRHTFTSKEELSYACLFHPTMKARLKIQ